MLRKEIGNWKDWPENNLKFWSSQAVNADINFGSWAHLYHLSSHVRGSVLQASPFMPCIKSDSASRTVF